MIPIQNDPTSRATSLAAASEATPASLDGAGAPSAPADTMLPDPVTNLATCGDPGAELAALLVKSGQSQQRGVTAARHVQEQLQEREEDAEVGALRQKADHIEAGGWVQGLGTVGQGATGLASAYAEAKVPVGDTSLAAHAAPDAWRGAGSVLGGLATIGAGIEQADATRCDADAASHRAMADRAKTADADLHDAAKTGQDLVSAALDFYKEYTSAKASERGAALHRS